MQCLIKTCIFLHILFDFIHPVLDCVLQKKTKSHTEVFGLTDDNSFKFLLADVYVEIIGY